MARACRHGPSYDYLGARRGQRERLGHGSLCVIDEQFFFPISSLLASGSREAPLPPLRAFPPQVLQTGYFHRHSC